MNYQNDSIRRQDRLLDQPEATELLRRGEYGILCMQRPEGGGYGVPLNYVWDEADAIYSFDVGSELGAACRVTLGHVKTGEFKINANDNYALAA